MGKDFLKIIPGIRNIASAFSGNHDFPADFGIAFQQRYLGTELSRCTGGPASGGSAADDKNRRKPQESKR